MFNKRNIFILVLLTMGLFALLAYSARLPKLFPFNRENALDEWEERIFKNRVLYKVEPRREGGYLLAQSKDASSGLLHRIGFDPKKYPMISWEWKVLKFPDKSKVKPSKEGWLEKDDYAARVYVIFPSWFLVNMRCIEYVWAEDLPEGKIITSPYWHNIKLIVVEAGRDNMGKWVFEERNIYEDYKKAFGRSPGSVGAIALMTDTDNTLSTAEAQYTAIRVGYKK